jgi:hypothetical protein
LRRADIILWILKTISGALATALFFAILYFFFITTQIPESWTIKEMYAAAMIGAFLAGSLSRIWNRNLTASCIGTIAGVFAGGTYIQYQFSDTNIGIPLAAWSYVTQFALMDLLLIPPGIIAWFATNWIGKRWNTPLVLRRNRVAILCAGAILTGALFNVLNPITEQLSFTRYNVSGLRHWLFAIRLVLFVASLGFSILAAAYHKGTFLRKSVFCALMVAILGLPYSYSSWLAEKIRRDGLISMAERLDPLVKAIESYMAERLDPLVKAIESYRQYENRLPDSLNDLVPAYISSLPKTASRTYTDYEYSTGADQGKPVYYLRIWVPLSFFSFDELEYSCSNKHSVDPSPGKRWEPIVGNWAYYGE